MSAQVRAEAGHAASDATAPAVLSERHGAVAVLTLNRPDVINAFNDAVRTGLPRALQAAEADPGVRVIVLRGSGERGFCVGADVKESRAAESLTQARRRLGQAAFVEAFDQVSKPVIAAIHGFCLGGGFEIALACDIRIAAADAVFALPETGLGLIPGAGGTQRLSRLIGLGRALDLVLTGDRLGAEEALRCGIVSRLVASPSDLMPEALRIAQAIAAKPPTATAYAKEATRHGLELDLKSGLALERNLFTLLLSTRDRREAADAFREKRAPVFSGD